MTMFDMSKLPLSQDQEMVALLREIRDISKKHYEAFVNQLPVYDRPKEKKK